MKKSIKAICLILVLCMLLGCGAGNAPTAESSSDESSSAAETTASEEGVPGDEFGNASVGTNGAVSSFSELTSQVGVDILQAGGNAVDAAVATIFAVGVTEPHHSGIGGSGLMTIYLAEEDKYVTIEYLEKVPLAVTSDYYKKDLKKTIRAAAVPSQVAGLCKALEEYGTMSLEEVLAPSIKIAREGFVLDSVAAGAMADGYRTFTQEGYEYLLELYTDDGIPYSAGDTYINEDLANTLETIAKGGADAFYKGELTQKMVDAIQAAGGCMTLEDFASYEAAEREPITTNYYGYDIVTTSYPSAGGVWLLEALNIMQERDIKSLEVGTNEYWRCFTESSRMGMNDGYNYCGDPDLYELPTATLISKDFAATRNALITDDHCLTAYEDAGLTFTKKNNNDAEESANTTHICAIDSKGNIVSSTNTVGVEFGCYFAVPGMGFVFNSHLSNMSSDEENADYLEGGKRARSSMAPTIVVKDGKPVMAVGSPGSLVIPSVIMAVINNTLLYDMSVQEAINYVRCFCIDRKSATGPETILTAETDRMSDTLIRQLEVYGYTFVEGIGDYNSKCGGVAAVYMDQETGKIYAGGDPRRGYKGLAY